MTDEELLEAIETAQKDVTSALLDFKHKWKDISLVDLLPLWAERNKQIDANKDVLRDSRKDLKAALKEFGAAPDNKSSGAALIQLFKTSFDKVVTTSKFAEQSFQSAFLILQNVSDPNVLVERTSLLVTQTKDVVIRMNEMHQLISQLRSSSDQASDLESCQDELRAAQEALTKQRFQLESSEKGKLDLVRRFEADMARKDRELDTLLETIQRQQSEQHPMDGTELKQALEDQKQSETERKLASVRLELAALEDRQSAHVAKIESEAAQDKARCVSLQKSLKERNQNVNELETELRASREKFRLLQTTSKVDWRAMTERVVGFCPESNQMNTLQDGESAEKILAAQFRKIENDLVACRVELSEMKVKVTSSDAQQLSTNSNILTFSSSSSCSISNEMPSNYSSTGVDKDTLMAITKQRNALQEEVTRLNVLHAMQRNNSNNQGGGEYHRRRSPYDVEGQEWQYGRDGDGLDLDDKSSKAFIQMNFAEQMLVRGYRMGMHDFWSRHALIIYFVLIHIFALCYAVHDLNPEIVSEVDRAQPTEW